MLMLIAVEQNEIISSVTEMKHFSGFNPWTTNQPDKFIQTY